MNPRAHKMRCLQTVTLICAAISLAYGLKALSILHRPTFAERRFMSYQLKKKKLRYLNVRSENVRRISFLYNSAYKMSHIRNPSLCSRFLQTRTAGQRTASPDRWSPQICHCQRMSCVQQAYQNHTDSRNAEQKRFKKKLSNVNYLREQIKYLEKMKDSFASSLTNTSVMITGVPARLAGIQKYIPFALKVKEDVQNDIKASIEDQKAQLRKLEKQLRARMVSKSNTTPENQETNPFEEAMQETHDSVQSFHSTPTDISTVKSKHMDQAKAVSEDDLMTSIFNRVWPTVKTEKEPKSVPPPVVKKKPLIQKDFISKTAIDCRTRALVDGIKTASTMESKIRRTEDFCKHILQYPNSRTIATKEKVIPYLLKFRGYMEEALASQANEALALIGYVDPVKGQGIRVLSIDGGGTRGLLAIECLKKLEEECQTDIRDMFDYVCGVSTGALVAAMAFLYRVPLSECEVLYRDFSRQMFTRNKVLGTSQLVWSHAFYDTEAWEKILKEQIGGKKMIEFSRNKELPKYSGMSTLINVPKLKNFLFRNYNLPAQSYSRFPGACGNDIWEVIRASSAAPGYFEEFKLGEYVHQDGGLMTNNPTAIAIHESRLLWPNESIQCVISLGTGRYEPAMELLSSKIALKDKVMKIVDSATDTESVHAILHDLLPQNSYYRFNPYLSEYFFLDEIRPEKIDQMVQETRLYLRKNDVKMTKAISQLSKRRGYHQRLADSVKQSVESVRS